MPSLRLVVVGLIGAIAILPDAYAEEHKKYGAELEGFDYPYEVRRFQFTSQGDEVFMAYMDVLPQQSNGRTAVLLHGRNFCAATWENSIHVLREVGYRVIAPDQIGFCKSSKPVHYQFSIQQLAANTNALVKSLGIDRASIWTLLWRHDRHPLCADVPGSSGAARFGKPYRVRGLAGEGSAIS